jgi:D-alanyl-lipoteichoic acid acyltransferase DltB (MBOAT superfamily)
MSLISLQFAEFFIVALILYFVVPQKFRWVCLLIGSLTFFILSAPPETFILIVWSIVTVYLAARYIEAQRSKAKLVFVVAVIANVIPLAAIKYVNGFASMGYSIFSYMGIHVEPFRLELLAPLGISFYTLMMISYLTDVYWGIADAQKNPFKLALFMAYFPHISSGPIHRYGDISGQLYGSHKFSYENLTFGLQRMLWGLFKKLVIAERLVAVVDPIYANPAKWGTISLFVVLVGTVFLIYADFSGNMDFVFGASQCFGIKMTENFRRPFFSLSIQEFWQRWHITLGLWLKDYIMFPILHSMTFRRFGKRLKQRFGKKAAKFVPTFIAMFILWFVNAIWHGAGFPIFACIMWFWFAVMVGQLLEPVSAWLVRIMRINVECFSWRLFRRIRTVFIYGIGAIFFSAGSISSAFVMFKTAISGTHLVGIAPSELIASAGGMYGAVILAVSILLLVSVEAFQERGYKARIWLANQNLAFRWIAIFAGIGWVLIFGCYGPGYSASEFIYAGF